VGLPGKAIRGSSSKPIALLVVIRKVHRPSRSRPAKSAGQLHAPVPGLVCTSGSGPDITDRLRLAEGLHEARQVHCHGLASSCKS
jgi:hypothetical protein